jgi:hypothetical protein
MSSNNKIRYVDSETFELHFFKSVSLKIGGVIEDTWTQRDGVNTFLEKKFPQIKNKKELFDYDELQKFVASDEQISLISKNVKT